MLMVPLDAQAPLTSVKPLLHVRTVHAPDEHVGLAFATWQTRPIDPLRATKRKVRGALAHQAAKRASTHQLYGSFKVLTQPPAAVEKSNPVEHED